MAIQHFCSGTGTKEAGTRADCDYCGQFYGTESRCHDLVALDPELLEQLRKDARARGRLIDGWSPKHVNHVQPMEVTPEQTHGADGRPLRVTHVSINYPSVLYPDGWTRATLEYKRRVRENKPHLRLHAILGTYSNQPLWWVTQEDRETQYLSRYYRSEQAISMATSRWRIHGHV
jgi:hypothetical protein